MTKKTYYINYTDGLNKPSFNIPFDEVDNSTSLVLYGQGRKEYAEGLWNNLLHLLENFANGNPNYTGPDNATEGQLWYDSFNEVLKVYKKVNKSPLTLDVATPDNTNISTQDEYIWVPLVDIQYLENVFGYDGYDSIDSILRKLSESIKNNINLVDALKLYYLPYTGGTLSGQLYLSNDPYVEYNNIPELYEAFSVGYLKSYLDNFAKTYKPEEGYFDIFGNSSRVDDTVGTYVPLNLSTAKNVSGSKLTINNTVHFNNSIEVQSAVNDTDLVKRIDYDNILTSSAIINKIKNTADFKKLINDAVTTELSKPENATTTIAAVPAVLSSYCVVNPNQFSGNDTSPHTILTQKVTPKSINSKFLITISLILSNGTNVGQAIAGLYKNEDALVEKFAIVEKTDNDAFPSFFTFIDSSSSINEITYTIKVNGTKPGTDVWLVNQSANKKNYATSSLTILEFNQVSAPSISWLLLDEFNELITDIGNFTGTLKITCYNCTINDNFNYVANSANIFNISNSGSVFSNINAAKQSKTDTEITFNISGNITPSDVDTIANFKVNSNIFNIPTGYTTVLNESKNFNIHCFKATTTSTTASPTTSTTASPTTTTTILGNTTTTTTAGNTTSTTARLTTTTSTTASPTTTTTILGNTTTTSTTLQPTTTSTTLQPTTTSTTLQPTTTSTTLQPTTTTVAPVKVGDAYNGGFYIGDIVDGGVKYKLILSPKSTERNKTYKYAVNSSIGNRINNTPSRTNGPYNTSITSQKQLDGFEAAWHCSQIDINGYSDWYLPAVDELIVMSANRKDFITGPNKLEWASPYNGSPSYGGPYYWSSTDAGKIPVALKVDCRDRFGNPALEESKDKICHVRAIRREPY